MEIKITKEKIEIFFLGLHKRDFNFNTGKVLKLKNYKNSIKTKFLTTLTILIKGLSVVFYLDKIYFKC